MKIIDAHLHLGRSTGFDDLARSVGHNNTVASVLEDFGRLGIEMGIVMGGSGRHKRVDPTMPGGVTLGMNGEERDEREPLPEGICYCAGVDPEYLCPKYLDRTLQNFERAFRGEECVGVKIYTGYDYHYPNDRIFHPLYDLAACYDIPIVYHMGDTASDRALLKYSHPLKVDEVAVAWRKNRFVIAHFGSPWVIDATEVAQKNSNVVIELSGMVEGFFEVDEMWNRLPGFFQHLRTWIEYLEDYDRIIYGTDWPLVNMQRYCELIMRLIPDKHREKVFHDNALRVFPKAAARLDARRLAAR